MHSVDLAAERPAFPRFPACFACPAAARSPTSPSASLAPCAAVFAFCARARALASCPGASLAAARALRCALPTCLLGTPLLAAEAQTIQQQIRHRPPAPPPHCLPLFVRAFVRSQVGILELPSAWPARVRRQASLKVCRGITRCLNSSRLCFKEASPACPRVRGSR